MLFPSDVSTVDPTPVFRHVRNIRSIDRCSFVNDITDELSALPSPSVDDANLYTAALRSVLDKHAPSAQRKIIERPSSAWFDLVSVELIEAKKVRRREERRWRDTGLTVFHEIYNKAKQSVSKLVNRAKAMFYHRKISSASSSKELYKITDSLMAKSKAKHLTTLYPLTDLPHMFSNFFHEKIIKIRRELDSMIVTTPPPQTDPFTGSSL